MDESLSRREAMVNGQIRPNRVVDERVTAALLAVPRELFVPKSLRGVAYLDEDLAIAEGRYLMEPVAFARILQAARLEADDVVGITDGHAVALGEKRDRQHVGLFDRRRIGRNALHED